MFHRTLNSFTFVACFLLCCTPEQPTHAEGGDKRPTGAHGVNRRVISHPGYAEVEGNFNMTFELPLDVHPTRDVEPSLGPYGDYPSIYLGGGGIHAAGGTVEVDAGLQYDQVWDATLDSMKGWGYFMRNTNPENGGNAMAQYNQPEYWDTTTATSKKWKSGQANSLNTYLKYTIYQGNDANTPIAEQPGWFSLTVDKLPVAGGGRSTVYWTHPNFTTQVRTAVAAGTNTIAVDHMMGMEVGGIIIVGGKTKTITALARGTEGTPPRPAVWGTLTVNTNFTTNYAEDQSVEYTPPNNLVAISTTVQSGGAAGTNTVVVTSIAGLEPLEPVTIGTEVVIIQNINAATRTLTILTATGNFVMSHAPGENVTQNLDCRRAYPSRPAAPWRGVTIFDPARLNQTRVKRVVAMTRTTGNKYELDGSWLECTFSGGRVRKVGEAATGHSWGAGFPTGTGDADDVDQGDADDPSTDIRHTGFDAPRNRAASDPPEYTGVSAWDRQWPQSIDKTATSRTIVEFPNISVVVGGNTITGAAANIEARRNTQASWRATEQGNSRYTRETVRINLRTVTRPEGEVVER